MLHMLADYVFFLLKTATIVVAILIIAAGIFGIAGKGKGKEKGKIKVRNLNEKFAEMGNKVKQAVLPKHEYKKQLKAKKKADKASKKEKDKEEQKRKVFVIKFHGDMKASAVENLRREVTAILAVATPEDEIVVLITSPGGVVPSYGLAASQLERIKQKKIPLTVSVDQVAASGGYLMAAVADKIIAAPFAYIGSIGVVAQIPNFNRLLKKNNIEFEQVTAGQYKRTLTMFGENTEEARQKMKEDVEDIHYYFKNLISKYRSQVDIDQIATGEYWTAARAVELKLVDGLRTSDDYLLAASETADVFQIKYKKKKAIPEKFVSAASLLFEKMLDVVSRKGSVV